MMNKQIYKNSIDSPFYCQESLECPENLKFLFKEGYSKRAGIIPYYVSRNGNLYLLLGRTIYFENKDRPLSDFGGGCKKYENPVDCAVREFEEETRRVVNIDLKNTKYIYITGKQNPHQVIFLVKMSHMDLNIDDKFQASKPKNEREQEMDRLEWRNVRNLKKLHKFKFTHSIRSLINNFNLYSIQ